VLQGELIKSSLIAGYREVHQWLERVFACEHFFRPIISVYFDNLDGKGTAQVGDWLVTPAGCLKNLILG
jgi:hypothetical protein